MQPRDCPGTQLSTYPFKVESAFARPFIKWTKFNPWKWQGLPKRGFSLTLSGRAGWEVRRRTRMAVSPIDHCKWICQLMC